MQSSILTGTSGACSRCPRTIDICTGEDEGEFPLTGISSTGSCLKCTAEWNAAHLSAIVEVSGWLGSSGLKGETECLIIVAQNQALSTGCHQRAAESTASAGRMCSKPEETINQILAGCTLSAQTKYIKRHSEGASYYSCAGS